MKTLKVTYLDFACHEQELILPDHVSTLRVNLSNGAKIAVECFEREKGQIEIRDESMNNRRFTIQPIAGNAIRVSAK